MSPKNALLAAASIAVLGMGVYLFIQVRSTPAQAQVQVTHATPQPSRGEPVASPKPEQIIESPHDAAPVPGSTHTVWERNPGNAKAAGENGPALTSDTTDDRKVDLKVDNLMELANKAYDSQDFDQATAIAGKILAKDPNNVRMLRIMVSANCIQGDAAVAQQHYEKLPKFDREQMKTRCDRYGVTFKDPP